MRRIKFYELMFLCFIVVILVGCASSPLDNKIQTSPTSQDAKPAKTQATVQMLVGCTVISPKSAPDPTRPSNFPPVGAEDWIRGPEDAAITFVEYGDFQ